MPYDLFISYAHRDNIRGQVRELRDAIAQDFQKFAGRDLTIFFDEHDIPSMADWEKRIAQGLRESRLFLALLSPNYFASAYCRREWEEYVRYEAMRQCLGEGVAPVFFDTLPDAADPKTDQALARWIDEIQRRKTFDLRPWHDAGELALQQARVRQTLEPLHASVREQLRERDARTKTPTGTCQEHPLL